MKEIILEVLDRWKNLQPNMASETARELLAKDLEEALNYHITDIIESIVLGDQL